MRALARAAALAVAATVALPGCIAAIATGEQDDEEAARHDARLLRLEDRMDRIEQHLPK